MGAIGGDYTARVVECPWGQLSDIAFRLWGNAPPRLTVERKVVLWEPEPYLTHLRCVRIELEGLDGGKVRLTAHYGERDGGGCDA